MLTTYHTGVRVLLAALVQGHMHGPYLAISGCTTTKVALLSTRPATDVMDMSSG